MDVDGYSVIKPIFIISNNLTYTWPLITWQGQKCKCFLSLFYDRGRNVLECALHWESSAKNNHIISMLSKVLLSFNSWPIAQNTFHTCLPTFSFQFMHLRLCFLACWSFDPWQWYKASDEIPGNNRMIMSEIALSPQLNIMNNKVKYREMPPDCNLSVGWRRIRRKITS